MTELVEAPLNDHSRSLYTSLVHENYSLAQMNFLIAILSSLILKKQYKYFPNNIHAEINNALPKHIRPNTDHSIVPPPTFVPQPPSSYVLQTVNPNVCINSFHAQLTNLSLKF